MDRGQRKRIDVDILSGNAFDERRIGSGNKFLTSGCESEMIGFVEQKLDFGSLISASTELEEHTSWEIVPLSH